MRFLHNPPQAIDIQLVAGRLRHLGYRRMALWRGISGIIFRSTPKIIPTAKITAREGLFPGQPEEGKKGKRESIRL